MPGAQRAIIIGGGINGVAPLGLRQLLFVTNITPAEASSSPRAVVNASDEVLFESVAGRTNTVIGPGTSSSNASNVAEVLIGNDVTSLAGAGGANMGIGENIGFTASSTDDILIGSMAAGLFPVGGVTGSSLVIVGRVTSLGGAFRNSVTAMGAGLTLVGSNIVVIGRATSATGNDSVVIGDAAATSAGTNVVIGRSASAAGAVTLIVGGSSNGTGTTTNAIIIGQGVAVANLSNVILIGQGVSPSGLAAGDICLGNNNQGGGGFSSRVVWFGDVHTSGVAVPAAAMRWKNAAGTNIAAGDLTITAPRSTGNAAPASIALQVGATGASGAVLQVATTVARVVGAAAPFFEISVDRGLQFVAQTNQAGAAAGTLANAPAAGDPAIWVPIVVNGVNRSFPAW